MGDTENDNIDETNVLNESENNALNEKKNVII